MFNFNLVNKLLAAGIVVALMPAVSFADESMVAPVGEATLAAVEPAIPPAPQPKKVQPKKVKKTKKAKKAKKTQSGPSEQETELKDIPEPKDLNDD